MNNNFWNELIEGVKLEKRVSWLWIISRFVLYVLIVGLILTYLTM